MSVLVRDTSVLIQSSISKKIAVQLNLASSIPAVESDPSQMQQVFMNLALNAGEAIGDGSGTISIATGDMSVDAAYIKTELDGWEMEPGQYVFLEVRDDGCGIDAATTAKIFDPFFTTKFQGRGLGLAAVAGIVRAHKGAIQLKTAPGEGAMFRVLLPAMPCMAAAGGHAVSHGDDLGGKGTILVIDDEELVRELARRSLERHGYEVLVAEDGAAAIATLRLERDRIGLAVLDLSMPGMSGEETLPHLRSINPELEVIISSGHSEAEALRPFRGVRISGFIQKPYTVQQLARKVKAALQVI
jgi:CheY-like chemotaxis protein